MIQKSFQNKAFSMVEILVALVLMAIGLLGLAGMTQLVMRGSDSASQMSDATDICQAKIEELKVVSFADLGSVDAVGVPPFVSFEAIDNGGTLGQIVQEVGLNSQGLTDCDFFFREADTQGSPCEGVSYENCYDESPLEPPTPFGTGSQQVACWNHVRSAGPYIYTRSFVVCDGEDHLEGTGEHPQAGNITTLGGDAYSGEVNCQASAATRPEALACLPNDILNPGVGVSTEKMVKVLCTWRKRDGRCGHVNLSALRVN